MRRLSASMLVKRSPKNWLRRRITCCNGLTQVHHITGATKRVRTIASSVEAQNHECCAGSTDGKTSCITVYSAMKITASTIHHTRAGCDHRVESSVRCIAGASCDVGTVSC